MIGLVEWNVMLVWFSVHELVDLLSENPELYSPLHSTGWIAETSATYCCSFLAGSSAISTASAAVACALDWIYGREARANMHA